MQAEKPGCLLAASRLNGPFEGVEFLSVHSVGHKKIILELLFSTLHFTHRCGAIKQRPSRTAAGGWEGPWPGSVIPDSCDSGFVLARALGFIRVSKLITASN